MNSDHPLKPKMYLHSNKTMSMFFFLFIFIFSIPSLSISSKHTKTFSHSFPLTSANLNIQSSNYKTTFKYSKALFVSLMIGTPPQSQDMLLDTGSQLTWTLCHKKTGLQTFDPSLSSSFSTLPCNDPICMPSTPDFTIPTTCDNNKLCHYSHFYADGTFSEGNLVREKYTFSGFEITSPMILGCVSNSTDDKGDDKGVLGLNLGRLSFTAQANITKFSYCVPGVPTTGSFYLGDNPNSNGFNYTNLLSFNDTQRMPNLDPLAYTLPMEAIRIGLKTLQIPVQTFRPDAGGSGQTIIDSGSELTYLVDAAYDKVKEEIVRLVGPSMKKGYTYGGVADLCFDGDVTKIGPLIGELVFEFGGGVEIVVEKERVLADVGGGIHCIAIGRSSLLGIPSNIIGNIHQQDMWVEYDLGSGRVGFGKADCSRSI